MLNPPYDNTREPAYNKWWFSFICVGILIAIIEISCWIVKPPKYNYPKQVMSYKSYNVNKSPDDVTSAFFKSIASQNPSMLKKCVLSRFLDKYNTTFYYNSLNDDILKDLLHKSDIELTQQFGEDWIKEMYITSVDVDQSTGYATIGLKCREKKFVYDIKTVKERQESFLSAESFIRIIGPRKVLEEAGQ